MITTPQKMTAKAATIHCSNKFVDVILAEDMFLCLAIKKKKACYKYFMHLGQNKACGEVSDMRKWRARFQDNATKLLSFL